MATPTSPLSFNDIYTEANGSGIVSPVSFSVMTNYNYFEGPYGNSSIGFNAWGAGDGDDGIYSVANNGLAQDRFGPYRNISYYYNPTTQYSSQWNITNNCPMGPSYDFNYLFAFKDTSLTYTYLSNGGLIPGGTSTGLFEATNTNTPLIYGCNWYLQVDTGPGYPADAFASLTINGSLLMNKVSMANFGPFSEIFDYTTYGNEYMTTDQPVSGKTGSLVEIEFSI
jgi:hypothetical protein